MDSLTFVVVEEDFGFDVGFHQEEEDKCPEKCEKGNENGKENHRVREELSLGKFLNEKRVDFYFIFRLFDPFNMSCPSVYSRNVQDF